MKDRRGTDIRMRWWAYSTKADKRQENRHYTTRVAESNEQLYHFLNYKAHAVNNVAKDGETNSGQNGVVHPVYFLVLDETGSRKLANEGCWQ